MLSVVTWNVNGIRARRNQVLELLATERPDVLVLQEIKASPDQIPQDLRELALADYEATWHGAGGYSGVAIVTRRDRFASPPRVAPAPFDVECRTLLAELRPAGASATALAIASIYVPNGGKDFDAKLRFLAAMRDWAADERGARRNVLVGGDLNVAREARDIHPKERKPDQIGARPDERALFGQLLEGGDLDDIGRRFDPENDDLFTWWPPWRNLRQRNIGWRIDYWLASGAWREAAEGARVLAAFGSSDHAPVAARFGI